MIVPFRILNEEVEIPVRITGAFYRIFSLKVSHIGRLVEEGKGDFTLIFREMEPLPDDYNVWKEVELPNVELAYISELLRDISHRIEKQVIVHIKDELIKAL